MTNKIFKAAALALAAITLSLPMSTTALAASHNRGPVHQKVERRDNRQHAFNNNRSRHDFRPIHHDSRRHDYRPVRHHDYRPGPRPVVVRERHHRGDFIAGAIIGAVVGHILDRGY